MIFSEMSDAVWWGITIYVGCVKSGAWWRHQMKTFSALLVICAGNSPVPGEFPAQRPVTQSFDVYFDLRPNKRLSKQSWGWWFETLPRPLWRHINDVPTMQYYWDDTEVLIKHLWLFVSCEWENFHTVSFLLYLKYIDSLVPTRSTHHSIVPHIGLRESGQHWFRWWFVIYSAQSHYRNQFWFIVNWTLRNKFRWNFNQNRKLFIHENASENVLCEMTAILFRVGGGVGGWVNIPKCRLSAVDYCSAPPLTSLSRPQTPHLAITTM